jgi:hypothetical protein
MCSVVSPDTRFISSKTCSLGTVIKLNQQPSTHKPPELRRPYTAVLREGLHLDAGHTLKSNAHDALMQKLGIESLLNNQSIKLNGLNL